MEYLLLKSLDFVDLALVLRLLLHLGRWLCIPVYKSRLKLSLVFFKSCALDDAERRGCLSRCDGAYFLMTPSGVAACRVAMALVTE